MCSKGLIAELENKFTLLRIKDKGTSGILDAKVERDLKKHIHSFESKLDSLYVLKEKIEDAKITEGEDESSVEEWGKSTDQRLKPYEETVDVLQAALQGLADEKRKRQVEMERAEEQEKLQERLEEAKQIQEMKLQMREKFEAKLGRDKRGDDGIKVKLPKLMITKFNGTSVDWLRFWNQFSAEIDTSRISSITKFSYLKELLNASVRQLIDGLPFSSEGYERAKAILHTKYGKRSDILTAHVKGIMDLPIINGTSPARVHEFFETLVTHVQAMETMGALASINGYTRLILDRLPGIRSDLVRNDDNWTSWDFQQLVEALRKWTERNPRPENKRDHSSDTYRRSEKTFQVSQQQTRDRKCVYCESNEHRSGYCPNFSSVEERRKIVARKRLCFNCLGAKHRADDCRNKQRCFTCSKKHHTSICDQGKKPAGNQAKDDTMMMTSEVCPVAYPIVVVKVNGIKCRALLDTGAGNSYASESLIHRVGTEPARVEDRKVEMMLHTTSRRMQIYRLCISNLQEDFEISVDVSKVDKTVLLSVPNPGYGTIISRYEHLKGVKMDDADTKNELPIHLVLGASEYSRIKTASRQRVGKPGDPVAEYTHFGWNIMVPGIDADLSNLYLTRTSADDFDRLCRLDVLGVEDMPLSDQQSVYQEFKEQLSRSPDGWYETGLIWKLNHSMLPSNKMGSLARLANLLRKLRSQPDLFLQYNKVIQDYLQEGIVEEVPDETKSSERVFYLPHRAVIRQNAESTKLRIVFDASARENHQSPSLNECLETGPSLQNLLWSIFVRNRFKPIAVSGDLKQAFLQVRIREEDRDVLRFHWVRDIKDETISTLRFTRALFGLNQSPFLLGGTIEQHLTLNEVSYPDIVSEVRSNLYVDDIISGGFTINEVKHFKETVVQLFKEAGFTLHKWHSNASEVEDQTSQPCEGEQTFAKQQLGVKPHETKLLGLLWNKVADTISVTYPEPPDVTTKRSVLHTLASIYDPLGLVSPLVLTGKMVFRAICDKKLSWDQPLPEDLVKQWTRFVSSLKDATSVQRSLVPHREKIDCIDLHAFGDASEQGTCAAVYAVVRQGSGVSQGIIAAKSRLAPKGTTVPRLELVSCHMAVNILENTRNALVKLPVRYCYVWSDSTTALQWIKGKGNYKQYVRNRVNKICTKKFASWRHVPGSDNPSDIGTRGTSLKELQEAETWWKGPDWLCDEEHWPQDITPQMTSESETEAKRIQEVLGTAVCRDDFLSTLMDRLPYKRAIRVTGWILRVLHNMRNQAKLEGPLKTEEFETAVNLWIKKTQADVVNTDLFEKHSGQFNLQKTSHGIYVCKGRLQGEYPIYLPAGSTFTWKLVENAHYHTLHGGVGLTMTKIRERYWIPTLRQLVKKMIRSCYGCKRFTTQHLSSPPVGLLPVERTVGTRPFEVIGIDYAGPIMYKKTANTTGKAYILLFSCSLTRAICLELLPNQTIETFLPALKRFIARRGRPRKIFSDNFSTFVAAAKWLKKAVRSEPLHDYLASNEIKWQFNLSRAPWWGGQFERMVGLVKQALYKAIGATTLAWEQLAEVLTDVEMTLNNRPLTYVEDDVQMPILTPNVMLFGQPNWTPEGGSECLRRSRS